MTKLVILDLGQGNLEEGLPSITAKIPFWKGNSYSEVKGSLPSNPQLLKYCQEWRRQYQAICDIPLRITVVKEHSRPVSIKDFRLLSEDFRYALNRWLDSGPSDRANSFGNIERKLRTQLLPSDEIQLLVKTDDEKLRRLPWHLWNLLEDYPLAEVAISPLENAQKSEISNRKPIRILAILGNSQGINVKSDEKDLHLLKQLTDVKIEFLEEPSQQKFSDRLFDAKGWDILFFAGHSASLADGQAGGIEINSQEFLTIKELEKALKKAIARGLKLAIFNSCDGLGLARELAPLQIPQLIVMREPVPDLVAQKFLKFFLTTFARGKSVHLAVREAREQLEGLEKESPGASWLPVLFQNPTAKPLAWPAKPDPISAKVSALVTLAVTGVVIGARMLGLFQPLELAAFDRLMRLRPPERLDDRLLIVKVTEEDVRAQPELTTELAGQRRSLSSRALEQTLETLNRYEPRVVALDIYRDFSVEPQYQKLLTRFQEDNRFLTICKTRRIEEEENKAIDPSPDLPESLPAGRVGFSDVVVDPASSTIRRHLLSQDVPRDKFQACQSTLSFSLLVALRYLYDEGLEGKRTEAGTWQIVNTQLKTLNNQAAGYQNIDDRGDQILLNYRSSPEVAQQVTLAQVLSDAIDPSWVRGRIVLIGTSDPQFEDLHLTPYSHNAAEKMPGVVIQAHMVSQILSAVQDRRPLLWWWPEWGELLWIALWSGVGGAIAWRCRSLKLAILTTGGTVIIITATCYLVLIASAGWIPLVPPVASLVTVSCLEQCLRFARQKHQNKIILQLEGN